MANNRKLFPGSVVPLPETEGLTPHGLMVMANKPDDRDQEMTILFSLAIPEDKETELEERVEKGEVLSLNELQHQYTPSSQDVDGLVSWLQQEHFADIKVSPNGTGVYARAKVSQIEESLQVKMARVTQNGITYTAARNAPSLPDVVANSVHAILGLQPFRHANKHRAYRTSQGGSLQKIHPEAAAAPVPQPGTPPYHTKDILKAYNVGTGLTGKGQTIAILIDTFPTDADLQTFWSANGLAVTTAQIQKINVKGVSLPAREGEETLDVQWTSGIAPEATIRIYASGSLEWVDLNRALDQIITDTATIPGMRQLSVSLGLGEVFLGSLDGDVKAQHQKFLRLAALGVNIFVSSGDAGSNPDNTGHNASGPLQAEFASSDPFVIGVGGTSLQLNADGTVKSETGWTGGGGGKSIFFKKPAWQKGLGVPSDNRRMVPDVSLVADPNTGALVIFNNEVQQIGGTSWSAPVWAAFCALINQARNTKGKPALPFLPPLIYPLVGTSCFRDIKAGSNGAYSAHDGYDLVTGLGAPDFTLLVNKLS